MELSFDTSGLVPSEDGWYDPATGDQFWVSHSRGAYLSVPLNDVGAVRRVLVETVLNRRAGVVEAFVVGVDALPGLLYVVKVPKADAPQGLTFMASIVVPRAHSYAMVCGAFAEGPVTGTREATVLEELLAAGGPSSQMWPPHPYAPDLEPGIPYNIADEMRWDERFPDHPLTRLRRWVAGVTPTIRVAHKFAALPPFSVR
ncbi:hypothetical protein [Mycobacteroides abscessus]|uniref:Uncharacterized protein n=3 Tax=Mycobacteroides abscessus TaxID=36809 RepID=B1MJJ2_MYCA9|nr:hypothetical protein [Mycobacteroides abscessus]EUA64909.1 hypothetical protein I542_5086 [Mycobacteroides abscessus 1948]ALM15642.1 hypothetical protein AOY11_04600 [Mycobacteroides abscessus]AMU44712.1 hypothetical protein A3O00_05220 [Mycobacteroides abscessus]AMU49680.1 hypothetical protein A3O01_05615 [Mycobacteroides abscessus]ANO08356.1 hypothetical protein BAB76_05620 [Mycobacteroides abscessus]